MKMTQELAEGLVNDLAWLFISAEGGAKIDENGNFNEEQIVRANEYAGSKFIELTEEFEKAMGEEWEIELPPNEEEIEE